MPQTLHVYSWPRTLTEWCVIQAFRRARCPGCLRRPAIFSAAFVSEVSEVVRFQTFSLPTAIVAGLLQEAAESAYEKAGGSAYRATRDAAEAAENDFIRTVTGQGHCQRRLAVREQCDAALDAHRRRYSAEARAAQRRCARAYWAEQSGHWLAIDLLAHRADSHPLRRIAQFAPAWWERFVRCLRHEISRCNITAFHVLDDLPSSALKPAANGKKSSPSSGSGANPAPMNSAFPPNCTTTFWPTGGPTKPARLPAGSTAAPAATRAIGTSARPRVTRWRSTSKRCRCRRQISIRPPETAALRSNRLSLKE